MEEKGGKGVSLPSLLWAVPAGLLLQLALPAAAGKTPHFRSLWSLISRQLYTFGGFNGAQVEEQGIF